MRRWHSDLYIYPSPWQDELMVRVKSPTSAFCFALIWSTGKEDWCTYHTRGHPDGDAKVERPQLGQCDLRQDQTLGVAQLQQRRVTQRHLAPRNARPRTVTLENNDHALHHFGYCIRCVWLMICFSNSYLTTIIYC